MTVAPPRPDIARRADPRASLLVLIRWYAAAVVAFGDRWADLRKRRQRLSTFDTACQSRLCRICAR